MKKVIMLMLLISLVIIGCTVNEVEIQEEVPQDIEESPEEIEVDEGLDELDDLDTLDQDLDEDFNFNDLDDFDFE